jgi:hypothetical protein
VRYLLKTALAISKAELWVIDKSQCAAERYSDRLRIDVDRTHTGERAVETFVDDLLREELDSAARDVATAAAGVVQTAIRAAVSRRDVFTAEHIEGPSSDDGINDNSVRSASFADAFGFGGAAQCRVVEMTTAGMIVQVGNGWIPVFMRWSDLENIPALFYSNNPRTRSIFYDDESLQALLERGQCMCVSGPLLPLLFGAGILEPVYVINRWNVRLGRTIPHGLA